MKISCEIIKDLLPLYQDNVCSEDSRIIIEEHLSNCSKCKKYINNMNTDIFNNISNENVEKIEVTSLKSLKAKIRGKNITISIVSIILTVSILFGGHFVIFAYENPIEYKDELLDITLSHDGSIDARFKEGNYYKSYGLTKTIEKNGVKENIAYIYYTDTIGTKYLSNKKNKEETEFSLGNDIVSEEKDVQSMNSLENISAVYYLVGNYTKLALMSNEEFHRASKDAVLLWQK